jgi:predicted anti-sigma-YlaC factor YlaD
MNHQLYEEWILGEKEISNEEQVEITNHLATCENCRQLAGSWQSIQNMVRNSTSVEPKPGFTDRWQAYYVQRKIRQQHRLAWWIFSLCLVLALITIGSISIPYITSTSLIGILSNLLFEITLIIAK